MEWQRYRGRFLGLLGSGAPMLIAIAFGIDRTLIICLTPTGKSPAHGVKEKLKLMAGGT